MLEVASRKHEARDSGILARLFTSCIEARAVNKALGEVHASAERLARLA